MLYVIFLMAFIAIIFKFNLTPESGAGTGAITSDPPKLPATAADTASAIKEHLARIEKTFEDRLIVQENQIKDMSAKLKNRGVSLPGVDEQKEKFSFFYALRYTMFGEKGLPLGKDKNADFTKAVLDETTQKAMDSQTDTLGGFAVPNQYIPQVIEPLRASTIALAAGAQQLTGLTGSPVQIPAQTGSVTASWTAENSGASATDMTLGELKLTPRQLSALIVMSRRSAMLSNPSLEAMAMNDISQQFARAVDLAYFEGTGLSNQPTGIKNVSGVGTSTLASVSFAKLVDFMGILQDNNGFTGKLFWAFKPSDLRKVVKLVDGQSKPIFDYPGAWSQNNGLANTPWMGNLLGFPVFTSTQLTSGHVVFGNALDSIIATWGSLILEPSTQASTAFQNHQLWVKGILDTDIGFRHAKSFVDVGDLS